MNKIMDAEPVIDVTKLNKSFNNISAVINLTLKILPGTIFGFLGANGSGKTTSLRMLCGLIIPDSGEGKCLGLNLFKQTKLIQAQIGYMPQQFSLYQYLTVYENLDFIARIFGLKNKKNRLTEIIDFFKFNDRINQIANTLSGGWKQRLSLAAALLHNPRLLLLDEPTSGIDPQSRIVIWNLIQKLANEGVTILLSTQHMDEAERCHQLAYMAAGKTLTQGSAQEVILSSGLQTWEISGENLSLLLPKLKKHADTMQIIEKGSEIRISALHDIDFLKISPEIPSNYKIKKTYPTLEDVFIYYVTREGTIK